MRSPFQFLDAYGRKDGDKFFGRDKEIRDLYEMVLKTPLVLVYGLSGTGKTSLVQCGLSKRFDRADWYPMFIRRGEDINLALGERLMKLAPDDKALPAAIQAYRNDEQNVGDLSRDLAKAVVNCLDNFYEEYLRPPYLLFDQFEETFILGDQKEEEVFAHIIRAIVDSGLPVKTLLIMREEYLGHLYHFERVVPSIYDYRFRVEEMDDRRVANVIVHSCRHFGIALEGLEDPQAVTSFLDDEKRVLPVPPTVETIISNVRGQEEETVKKSVSRIQLPYLQVYLDGLYRQVLADESWKKIGLQFSNRFPKIPPDEVIRWLQEMDTLETVDQTEGMLSVESKAFCLEALEKEGTLTRNKEGQLLRANYPSLSFTRAEVEACGDIEKVLAGFLNNQLDHIREQLIKDYREQKISTEVLTLVSDQLDQATIRSSQIQLPGLISHDQFEACLEILEEAKMITSEGEGLYRPLVRREKLSKQAANLQEQLDERFAASAQPIVEAFLNGFVTLEGTKKPLTRTDISSARLSDQQIELCLTQLENARILRRSEDYYEVAHDALAKRIAQKRSQEQVEALKIAKIVHDRYSAFKAALSEGNKKIASEIYLSDQELVIVDQHKGQLIEEKLLLPEEWDFVAKSERQRRRKAIYDLVKIIGLLLLVFLAITVWRELSENTRLNKQLCAAHQAHAQTLLNSKQYFAAIETFEKAKSVESCEPEPLDSMINTTVGIICNQCDSLVGDGEKLMDDRKFSQALEKYTEAREIFLARERLDSTIGSYFQNCTAFDTLNSITVTKKIEWAKKNLIDINKPQFDSLIALGDFFYKRGTPFHWDALQHYRAADSMAISIQLNADEAKSRITRITPALLRDDLRHLTATAQTMEASDAPEKNIYIRQVNAKAAAIRQDILLRAN